MADNKSKISQEEYLNELAIMMREAFSEACDNDLERYQLKLNAIKALTELEETELPLSAPELYKDREPIQNLNNKKENPFQFLYRVYGAWLGQGLVRPDIKKLDLRLYEAIYKRLHERSPTIPSDLDIMLPKKQGRRVKETEMSSLKLAKNIRKNMLALDESRRFSRKPF